MSRYLVFAAVSLVLLLSAMSGTAVAVAFPVITSSFNASLILAGWVLSIYQLVSTVTMPLAGKTSDAFGRKFTFMLSLALFTLGSLLCALAPNIQLLIFFRVIQGIGGGGFMPSAAGIVADQFPRSRQQALGLFTSVLPIGQIVGPNLGGWMTGVFGWRSVFWFNIPLSVVALIAAALLLQPGQKGERHIDLIGTGLFAASLFALLTGFSELGNGGTAQSRALVGLLFAASIGLMIAFVRHESRIKDPIIDLEVLREKPFVAANIYNFVYGACVLGVLSFVPLYAVSVYNMSILQSGLILTPRSIGMLLASTVTSVFLVRWGYRWPMLIGTAAIVLSLVLLSIESPGASLLGMQWSSMALLLGIMSLSGLGMGVSAPAANNACIELMPDRVATITGIRGMFRQSGAAVSIAITSLVLHSVGDMARGFYIVFLGLAGAMLITIPTIFAMPSTAEVLPSTKKA